jgi:hypothetical protein
MPRVTLACEEHLSADLARVVLCRADGGRYALGSGIMGSCETLVGCRDG